MWILIFGLVSINKEMVSRLIGTRKQAADGMLYDYEVVPAGVLFDFHAIVDMQRIGNSVCFISVSPLSRTAN